MEGMLRETILKIVRERQRGVKPGRGVIPAMVQCWLDEYKAEQTLRRYMAAMGREGLLERVGGEGSRRGYRVDTHPKPALPPVRPPLQIAINVRIRVA